MTPAERVLEYIPPGYNVRVADVPSPHRLDAAYSAGYVAFVSEPGVKGRLVTLTPHGRNVRRRMRQNMP